MEQKQNASMDPVESEQSAKLDPIEALDPDKRPKNPKSKIKIFWMIVIIILLLLMLLSAIFYFVFYNRDGSAGVFGKKDQSQEQTQEQQQDSKVDLSQYDGKILQITSSKSNIKGTVLLTYNSDRDKLEAQYQALLNDDLPVNGTCGGSVDGRTKCQEMIRHEYAQQTTSQQDKRYSFGVFLYPVLCNKTKQLEKSEWDTKFDIYGASSCEVDNHIQEKTSTFLIWGKIEYDSYEDIQGLYDVVVYDSSQYWVETTDKNSQAYKDDPEGSRYFELESDKSIVPENKVKSHVMEFKE